MKKQIAYLSKKLIEVPSTKDNRVALDKVLEIAIAEIGNLKPRHFERNNTKSLLFGNIEAKKYKLLLNAHLDVVPAPNAGFRPYIKNGRLYGRGSQDMKAAAAVMIIVFKQLRDKVNYPLALQLVTDEEVGGFNGTKHQIKKGIRADFVICGEPTGLDINNKAKGIVWADIKATGRSAHGAYLWKGDNAVAKMNKLLKELYKAFPIPEKEKWITTMNLAKIKTTNKTYNKVPDNCSIGLDIRYVPEETETIVARLESLVPKDMILEIKLKEPPQFTDENNEFIKLLRKTVKDVTGKYSKIIAKHGGSDLRHFNEAGCCGVTFGPAGGGMHTNEEWVELESLEKYYKVLHDYLLNLE